MVIAAFALALACAGTVAAVSSPPTFTSSISVLSAAQRKAMTPSVWRAGCPVGLGSLRLLRLSYWTFDGRVRTGRLVVHKDVAEDVVTAFHALFDARFPIRWMVPIERFGGSDFDSIEADNTSAFNCRYVDGTKRWSNHAYGKAIDINPIENPYVTSSGTTSHPASRRYVKRTPVRPGMLVAGGAGVRAFDQVGWGWGGRWSGAKDYQHVSASGR